MNSQSAQSCERLWRDCQIYSAWWSPGMPLAENAVPAALSALSSLRFIGETSVKQLSANPDILRAGAPFCLGHVRLQLTRRRYLMLAC